MMRFGLNTHDRKPPTSPGQGPHAPGVSVILQGAQQKKHLTSLRGTGSERPSDGPTEALCVRLTALALLPPYLDGW